MIDEYKTIIEKKIEESILVKQYILDREDVIESITNAAVMIINTYNLGGKLLLCGNGGSASDALHIAGELLGRFQKERKAYAAMALNADVATMTAISNDYGFDSIFSKQVEGLLKPEDILLGISTSGNSTNIIKAFEQAKINGGKTILLTGKNGGRLKELSDISIIIPSDITAHIQEAHMCIYHILCGLIEDALM